MTVLDRRFTTSQPQPDGSTTDTMQMKTERHHIEIVTGPAGDLVSINVDGNEWGPK